MTTPETTAKLWRIMFDYLTRDRKLNNLIRVYSAALTASSSRCFAFNHDKT